MEGFDLNVITLNNETLRVWSLHMLRC